MAVSFRLCDEITMARQTGVVMVIVFKSISTAGGMAVDAV